MLNCSSIWGQFDQVKLQSRYNQECYLFLLILYFFPKGILQPPSSMHLWYPLLTPTSSSLQPWCQIQTLLKTFGRWSLRKRYVQLFHLNRHTDKVHIWLHQVSIIVMLLGIEESTKRKEKQYWPDENSGILHLGNKIDIEHLSSCAHSTYVSR